MAAKKIRDDNKKAEKEKIRVDKKAEKEKIRDDKKAETKRKKDEKIAVASAAKKIRQPNKKKRERGNLGKRKVRLLVIMDIIMS